MGRYTENLFKRRTASNAKSGERLVSAAILRDDEIHSGHRSHYMIRSVLGDEDCGKSKLGDIEGFLTSEGRFVTRAEGMFVGAGAGQCRMMVRDLLSSDIDW